MILDQAIRQIKKAGKILLLTHEDPDGDAVGSLLALKWALEDCGKTIQAVCPHGLSPAFAFLPGAKKILNDFLLGDYELIIVLDCGDLRRTGFGQRLKQFSRVKRKIINIDHHPKNDLHRLARLNLVDSNASSTCEIVFQLLKGLKVRFNPKIATCLLCGLYTDTGAFQHSNTNPKVLKIASELMRYGGRLKDITRNITTGKSVPALRLWGLVLSRLQVNKNLGLVASFVRQKDLKDSRAKESDLAGAVNIINTIPEMQAAILFSERPDGTIKASLRTERDDLDLSRLAAIFGGGGLKKASGFTIEGKIIKTPRGWKIR